MTNFSLSLWSLNGRELKLACTPSIRFSSLSEICMVESVKLGPSTQLKILTSTAAEYLCSMLSDSHSKYLCK